MTPAQAAQRQSMGINGLIPLNPPDGWEVQPLPNETAEEAAYRAAVDAAMAVLSAYDGDTAEHSDDVVTLSEAIADRLNVPDRDKRDIAAAAALHDIGKVAVPPEILNKPGKLTAGEWRVIRRHTLEGEQILATVPEISRVATIVRSCHERYDGLGYPDGLAGERIPLAARIVFCADAFHAMRCDRPYRAGRPAAEAIAELKANAGSQFDPVVVAALCEVYEKAARQRRAGKTRLRVTGRSQRLAALLATMAIGGTAMAATGGYKHLPLVPDGHGGSAPASAPDRAGGAVGSATGFPGGDSANGAEGRGGRDPAGATPRARVTKGTTPGHARNGSNPSPRGVAHGVNGTAPGQSVRKKPKPVKAPKTHAPKVKTPKVKAPKVDAPKVKPVHTPKPKAEVPAPEAKAVKPVKAPKPVKPPKPAKPVITAP